MTIPAANPQVTQAEGLEAGFIWFNGELVPQAEAKVSVLSHALHYGTSVFEGIRAYETPKGSAVFRLPEHAQRLLDSAKIIGMPVTQTVAEISEAITSTVRKNAYTSCYIRPLLWFGSEKLAIGPRGNSVHFMVAAWPWGTYLGEDAVQKGARLMTSSWRRSPGDVMATKAKAGGNYVNSVLANLEAHDNGFDEALLLDKEGFVAEGSGENIFFIKNSVLHPVAHSINLRGITRDSVISIAKWLDMPIEVTMATRDELYTADEVFMVGTAAEVTPIASIDRRDIGSGTAGELTLKIRDAYLKAVSGQLPEFEAWLSYV
ncbi:MAG: branched-chain amino acid transaminase [Deinococcota bacterium]